MRIAKLSRKINNTISKKEQQLQNLTKQLSHQMKEARKEQEDVRVLTIKEEFLTTKWEELKKLIEERFQAIMGLLHQMNNGGSQIDERINEDQVKQHEEQ